MTLGDDAGPHAATRTRRHTGRGLFWLIVILVMAIVIDAVGLAQQAAPKGSAAGNFPPGTLGVNFGLDRSSLTRSVIVFSGSEPSPAPSVLTARVEGDLVQDSGLKQFPADQITLAATPAGPQRVQVVATLSPMNPEKVGDGTFNGTIDVYTGSETLFVPLQVYLTAKSGARAILAFLLLLLGAVLGLSVKWITEALLDLSAARRRFDRLRHSLKDCASLPDDAAAALAEISDRIESQDISGLDELFKSLEEHRRSLSYFSAAIENVNSRIREQKQILEHEAHEGRISASSLIEVIVDGERARIRGLQSTKWPWGDHAESVLQEARDLSRQSLIVSSALKVPERYEDVLHLFQRDKFREAVEKYLEDAERGNLERESSELNTEPSIVPWNSPLPDGRGAIKTALVWTKRMLIKLGGFLRGPKNLTAWMAERARAIAGAASVLVVAIVGLVVQYMNSTSFTGSLSDWLTLLLWAAVIELSGVSLLDVVGRLSLNSPRK